MTITEFLNARLDDDQVTAHEAAAHLGISRDTIDTWVRRGHLEPIPNTGRPRRFWMADVYTCETARRTHWKHR